MFYLCTSYLFSSYFLNYDLVEKILKTIFSPNLFFRLPLSAFILLFWTVIEFSFFEFLFFSIFNLFFLCVLLPFFLCYFFYFLSLFFFSSPICFLSSSFLDSHLDLFLKVFSFYHLSHPPCTSFIIFFLCSILFFSPSPPSSVSSLYFYLFSF